MHKVWQEEENINDDLQRSRLFFEERGLSVGAANVQSFVDSCYADKRYQATLNYNGEVFKCTARDFKDNSGEGVLSDEGVIIWNEKYEKRLNSKFNNRPCKECRILPICGGGCTQHALENEGVDYCVYGFDEEVKTKMVVNRFMDMIMT